MAEPIEYIDLVVAEGDPWTPPDASIAPTRSEQFSNLWHTAHRDDGSHLPPAPQAIAFFDWSGSAYNPVAGSGLSVTRLAAGHLQVNLLGFTMANSDAWICTGIPHHTEPGAAFEAETGKSVAQAELKIRKMDGTALDCDVLIAIYGDLA